MLRDVSGISADGLRRQHRHGGRRAAAPPPGRVCPLPPADSDDSDDAIPPRDFENSDMKAALACFFSGDDAPIAWLAEKLWIDPNVLPTVRDRPAFVHFLAEYVAAGAPDDVWVGARVAVFFAWEDGLDFTSFLTPPILSKILARAEESEGCTEKAHCFEVFIQFSERYQAMIVPEYPPALRRAITWAASDCEERIDMNGNYVTLVETLGDALLRLIDNPQWHEFAELLWTTASELLSVDATPAIKCGLVAFRNLLRKGCPPAFDDTVLLKFIEFAKEGEPILRPLFEMIQSVSDDGAFLRTLIDAGLLASLIELKIEFAENLASRVYRFFTDVKIPPSVPGLLPFIIDRLPNATYQTQIEMLGYIGMCFEHLNQDDVRALIAHGLLHIIAQIITDDSNFEIVGECAMLAGHVLTAAAAQGAHLEEEFGFMREAAEATIATQTDEVDAVLQNIIALFGG
jgi:hypothetical protein